MGRKEGLFVCEDEEEDDGGALARSVGGWEGRREENKMNEAIVV